MTECEMNESLLLILAAILAAAIFSLRRLWLRLRAAQRGMAVSDWVGKITNAKRPILHPGYVFHYFTWEDFIRLGRLDLPDAVATVLEKHYSGEWFRLLTMVKSGEIDLATPPDTVLRRLAAESK